MCLACNLELMLEQRIDKRKCRLELPFGRLFYYIAQSSSDMILIWDGITPNQVYFTTSIQAIDWYWILVKKNSLAHVSRTCHVTKNMLYAICKQQKWVSICISTQSDHHICCFLHSPYIECYFFFTFSGPIGFNIFIWE